MFAIEIEFLPLIFIVIYVGAIAVLFLFVVMMIDIKLVSSVENMVFLKYFSIENFILLIFFFELLYCINKSEFYVVDTLSSFDWIIKLDNMNNLKCIGQFLYTYYFIHTKKISSGDSWSLKRPITRYGRDLQNEIIKKVCQIGNPIN